MRRARGVEFIGSRSGIGSHEFGIRQAHARIEVFFVCGWCYIYIYTYMYIYIHINSAQTHTHTHTQKHTCTHGYAQEGIDPEAFLSNPEFSPALRRVIQRLLERADELYIRADAGISMLPRSCRVAIRCVPDVVVLDQTARLNT
jgi:hypothetical protein